MNNQTVLLTDYAWPDDTVERHIIESADMKLVTGPATPSPAPEIECLVREHKPSAIMTNWAIVSATAIAASPQLKIVARLGVGIDNIAVDEATKRGIWVTNVPDYSVEEVSDHAVGFALAWTRGIVFFDREVRAGRWTPASANLRRLAALTCGIIGFGRIGRATAHKLAAFGCRLLVYDPVQTSPPDGVEFVGLSRLFSESDIVIVHAPLTEGTRHLVNGERLALMRPGGLIINVSRGGLVNTAALIEALRTGHLAGAALDVLETEPDVPSQLRAQPGAILT